MGNLISFVFMVCLVSIPVFGQQREPNLVDGNSSGGGGQDIAAEFSQAAFYAIGTFNSVFNSKDSYSWCSPRFPKYKALCDLDKSVLLAVVANTSLKVLAKIEIYDSKSKKIIDYDALNFPAERLIQISQAFWTRKTSCDFRKIIISLHEYLSVAGLEKNSYPISSLLRNWYAIHGEPSLFYGCVEEMGRGSDH